MVHPTLIVLGSIMAQSLARSATSQGLIDESAKFCANVPEDLGLTRESDPLLGDVVGPRNIIADIAFDTECTSIDACVTKYQSDLIPLGIGLGLPLIFAILSLFLWVFLSCCACSRACRQSCIWCCCKEKEFPSYFSRGLLAFIWTSFVLFLLLALADTAFSGLSAIALRAGSESILCRSLTLASDILNGGNVTAAISLSNDTSLQNISFIGADPLYTELVELASMLDTDSPLMSSINATVNDTTDFQNALNRLDAYLQLTEDMLGNATNLKASATGEYECVVCKACCGDGSESYVSKLRSAISVSLAINTADIRSQILSTLTGPGLTVSRDAVNNAVETLGNITKTIEEDVGQPVLDNSGTIDTILLALRIVTIVLACSSLVPVFWFILSVIYGVARSYMLSYSDPDDKPRNPCVASTGWCLSLLYAIFILLLGGTLVVAGYLQASACEAFGNLDVSVDRVVDRYNLSSIAESVLTTCLKSTGDGDFVSTIKSGDLTAREVLSNITRIGDLVDYNYTVPSISNSAEFKALVDSMLEYKGLFMIPSERISALRANQTFNENGPMSTEQTMTGYGSSAYCSGKIYDLTKTPVGENIAASLRASDFSLPPDLSAISVPGASAYRTSLSTVTGLTYTGTCSDLSVVKNSFNPFSSLLFWKAEVMGKTNFACNTLNEVLDITTGLISFDQTSGTCASPAEFDTYILALRSSLVDASALVDEKAEVTKTRIETDILANITDTVISFINTVLDHSDCRVLRFGWNALYNSFCTKLTVGVVGLGVTFSLFGGLTLLAVVCMVIIWRNLKDNLCLWKALVRERAERRASIRSSSRSPRPSAVQTFAKSNP